MNQRELLVAVHALAAGRPVPFEWVIAHAPRGDVAAVLARAYGQARGDFSLTEVLGLCEVETARRLCRELSDLRCESEEFTMAEGSADFARRLATISPLERDWRVARIYLSHARRAFLDDGAAFVREVRARFSPAELRAQIARRIEAVR